MNRANVLNVLWTSFASYAEFALYLACGVVVARALGPQEFGVYSYSVWLVGLLILFVTNGLCVTAIQQIASARGQGNVSKGVHFAYRMRRWQLGCLIIVTAAGCIAFYVASPKEWGAMAIWFAAISLLSLWSRSTLLMDVSIGKGFGNFRLGNWSGIIGAGISLILALAWKFFDGNILGFFMIYALSGLIAATTARWLVRQHLSEPPRKDFEVSKDLRTQAITTGVYFLLIALMSRTVETYLLKQYHSAELVGFFVIAGTLSKGITDILVSGYDKVLLPTMSRSLAGSGNESIEQQFQLSVRVYWVFGLFAVAVSFLAIELIVKALYGVAYSGAVLPTRLALMTLGLTIFMSASNALLLSTGNQLDRVKACLFAMLINWIAAYLLVPTYGLIGAVGAMALGLVVNSAVSVWQVKKRFSASLPYKSMFRFMLSGIVAMLLAFLATQKLGLWMQAIVGLPLFCMWFLVASLVFGAWNQTELDFLERQLQAKLGPRSIICKLFASARK